MKYKGKSLAISPFGGGKRGRKHRPPIKKLPNKKSYAKGNILLKYKGKRLGISPFGGGKKGEDF